MRLDIYWLSLKREILKKYNELKTKSKFDNHPIFKLIAGEVEEWEIMPKTDTVQLLNRYFGCESRPENKPTSLFCNVFKIDSVAGRQ